jgi:Leucine-rich repeat (LRR) protein
MRSILAVAVAIGAAAAFAACDDGGPGAVADAGTDAGADAGEEGLFTDANLEQCVRDALGVSGGALSGEDLASLSHLECRDMGIATLDGLELCTGLVSLSLWENEIEDATPLAGLAGLEQLDLGNNAI